MKNGGETAALLVALMAMMPFDHWLWSLAFGGYLFWLIMGMTEKLKF